MLFIGTVYGVVTHGEAVGMGALLLSGGLFAMIGFYLAVVDRRSGQMPEDDPHGEIADAAGEVGTFAPWSWWPLVLAGSAAMAFLALAVGWWLLAPAVCSARSGWSAGSSSSPVGSTPTEGRRALRVVVPAGPDVAGDRGWAVSARCTTAGCTTARSATTRCSPSSWRSSRCSTHPAA